MERVTVRYVGPDDQINHDVANDTGGGIVLEHGKTYEVNSELAELLVESSQQWERAGAPTLVELRAQAAELGIENADKLGRQAVTAAIAAKKAEGDADGITGEVNDA